MSDEAKVIATIIPAETDDESLFVPTRGTRVMVDGKELKGVTKVVLVAEPNDVWRAKIDCFVSLQDMPKMLAEVKNTTCLSLWRKTLLRLAGVKV